MLPRGDELLLIHVKSQHIGEARALMADAVNQRVSSAAAVVAHHELYLLEGRVDEALADMEQYAAEHPRDAAVWERLARMYADAQRLDEQRRAVEHVYSLERTADMGRRLITLHRWSGDERAEAAVLHDLVASGDATVEEHLRSARLEAAFERPRQAFDALERLRRREPGAFDYPAMELYASLLLETQGAAGLAGPLQVLPIAREQPDVLVQLAKALTAWGRPDAAVALFETSPGVDAPAERLVMRARAAAGTSEAQRVAAELSAIDAARPLAPAPLEALVNLLLSLGDYQTAEWVLGNPNRPADPELVSRAIGHAVERGARDRAQALISRLGDSSLAKSPLLALDLAVERGDVTSAKHWIGQMEAMSSISPDQIAALAKFESRLGLTERSFNRLAALVKAGLAPDWAAGDFAVLASDLGHEDAALGLLASAGSPGARTAWARLAVTTGRIPQVNLWLRTASPGAMDPQGWRDLYYLLAERGHTTPASDAAERLVLARGSDDDRLLLGLALLADRNPVEALVPLRRVSSRSADAWQAYDSALVAALQSGADVGDELRQVFWQRISDPQVPRDHQQLLLEGLWAAGERATLFDRMLPLARADIDRWLSPLVEAAATASQRDAAVRVVADSIDHESAVAGDEDPPQRATVSPRRTELVRALMALDASDDVLLPQLRHMAAEAGESWVYAYDERLAAGTRTAERVQLWDAVARSADAPIAERRAAASRLVELGATAPAIDVLQTLAAASGPGDPELLQLLSVWGPQPTEPQLAWLSQRFLDAPPNERPEWLSHMLRLGSLHPPSLRKVAELTLDRADVSLDELRLVGRAMLAQEWPDLAEAAFGTIVAREPGDLESLRWLGALAFYDGRADRAREWLDAYVAAGGDAAESLYQLGELARSERDADRARRYFAQALARLDDAAGTAVNRPLLANVLVRMADRSRATEVFESILDQDPTLDHVRADYVGALLQWGHYAHARRVLDNAPESTGRDRRDPTASAGVRRLALLRVQSLTREGHYAGALQVLETLAAQFPSDPDVLLARAGFDADRGRAADADRGYELARQRAPQREDIERIVRERALQQSPQAAFETATRSITDGWDERSGRLTLSGRVRAYMPVTLSAERLQLTADRARRADGVVAPLTADLSRFEAVVTLPVSTDTSLAGALFGTSAGAGGGVTLGHDDLRGRTEIMGESGRPFWDFLEGAADDGRRDRVAIQRQGRLRPDAAAWAQLAWNRYRLASGASAHSTAVTFGLVRTVRRAAPAITLQYGLDKEHRLAATQQMLPDGQTFMPIPIVSREVHLVGAIGRFSLRDIWDVEATGGYTIDRLGGHGSFLTARLTPRPAARAGLSLWIDRRLYAIATSQQVLRTGAQFTVRFSQ